MDSYSDKVGKSISQNSEFNIKEVADVEIIKTFPHYHKYLSKIIDILREGNYKDLDEIKDDSESFDDLTVVKFKRNNQGWYYAMVYDDWELWTDPSVAYVFTEVFKI